MKEYVDNKRHAKVSDIKAGDAVLVKQHRRNKLTTNYDIRPYKVIQKKGSVLILSRDNKSIMRNISLVKKVPDYNWKDVERFDDDQLESSSIENQLECVSSNPSLSLHPQLVIRRSAREVRAPERLIETMA